MILLKKSEPIGKNLLLYTDLKYKFLCNTWHNSTELFVNSYFSIYKNTTITIAFEL